MQLHDVAAAGETVQAVHILRKTLTMPGAAPLIETQTRRGYLAHYGVTGQFATIQAAVDAARPGDWILVGPGDYHESGDVTHPPYGDADGAFGGVFITTPGVVWTM